MTLEVQEVSAGYGRAVVLSPTSLVVGPGETVALIGANGAGKSTLVKAISGLLPIRSGSIVLNGERIDMLSTGDRLRRGLAHVPEGRQVFAGLTVEENLLLGNHLGGASGNTGGSAARIREVCEIFPILAQKLREAAGNLSGGQQQMLAIARGLMSRPRYLILDEPSLGLSPILVSEIFQLVVRLGASGISILISEQNARQTLSVANRAYVLEMGCIVAQGNSDEILASTDIVAKYLGGGEKRSDFTRRRADISRRLSSILERPRENTSRRA